LIRVSRTVLRYQKKPGNDKVIRAALRRLADKKRAYGYRMLWRKLRQQGHLVNHKRVYRLYREEKLALRRKRRRKTPEHLRVVMPIPTSPNDCWSMDFVSDALTNRRPFRVLTVIDDATRENVGLEAAHSFSGHRLTLALDRVAIRHGGYPKYLRADNGPEMRSAAVAQWAHEHGIRLVFIEPGKPTQNAYCESFNGILRRECLNEELFISIPDAQRKLDRYHKEYNEERPHGSLGITTTPRDCRNALFKCVKKKKNQETLIRGGTG